MTAVRILAATIVLVFNATAAFATPYVDVRAFWSVSARDVPDGVSVACTGDAQGNGSGCGGSVALNTTVTTPQSFNVSASGAIVVTNTTDHALTGYIDFLTDNSAFNPGGPAVGLSVDDPLTQAARFASGVSGPGTGDSHSCSVGYLGHSGAMFSNHSCGVGSPDESPGFAYIDLSTIAPHASSSLLYSASITARFDFANAVPEASSLALLMIALTGLAAAGIRRGRLG